MSSGDFSDIVIKPTDTQLPILLDQIAIKFPIHTAIEIWSPNQIGAKKGPELIDHPFVGYVADPRIYHHARGAKIIRLCGRDVALTNGRRIFKAAQDQPLSHCHSKKRAPQDKSINGYEEKNNQFKDGELSELLATEGVSADTPYKYLLSTYLSKLGELATFVVTERDLLHFNTIKPSPFNRASLTRMELYLEIPYANKSDDVLRRALSKLLVRAFGAERVMRFKVEEDQGEGDDRVPALVKWVVPSKFLSPKLTDRNNHVIKFYRKGQKIRLEIQLNSPSVKKTNEEALDDLVNDVSYEDEIQAIAEIAAGCLRVIEGVAKTPLARLSNQSEEVVLQKKILERWRVLLPRSYDNTPARTVMAHLAKHGFIDMRTAKKLELNPQTLKRLANEDDGFLRRENKGLDALRGKLVKRINNANYVLVPERLSLSGRRSKESSNDQAVHHAHYQRILERIKQNSYSNAIHASMLNAASGSASQTGLAAILVSRK